MSFVPSPASASSGVGTMESSVSERLVARRAHLQQFCVVEPVKQHLRLVSYYQLARQLYRQMEAYYRDGAWDNAYVFMAKFIKLCSKVIPAHHDYDKPMHHKEREWVSAQAQAALKVFDAILDGMEEDERETIHIEQQTTSAHRRRSSSGRDRHRPVTTVARSEPTTNGNRTLEDRLAALRLEKAATSDAAPSVPPSLTGNREKLSSTFSAPPSHGHALEQRLAQQRFAQSSVAYPSVGKSSWMQSAERESATPRQRTPIMRQRSLEALEQLTSGKHRTLEIPTSIIAQFTQIAAPNTNRLPNGIETCGILAGVLNGTRLVITTLIIPKQEGSSDMCTMKNEEELFDYCFSHDLLTLGWIHTHPRQTCFLSSVDIHTQCGFQSILPEAVAIVVAPTDLRRNVGIFRLTEPEGLQLIQNCNLTGFHTHPDRVQIYSDALSCDWDARTTANIVDMRYNSTI